MSELEPHEDRGPDVEMNAMYGPLVQKFPILDTPLEPPEIYGPGDDDYGRGRVPTPAVEMIDWDGIRERLQKYFNRKQQWGGVDREPPR